MDRDRWRIVEQLLERVLEAEPHEREAVLAECGAQEDALRREVEALLAHEDALPPILAEGVGALVADFVESDAAATPDDPLVGDALGPWRVRHEIGRGGMARVFLAEREHGNFAQRAAVKVLRVGLDGELERARFESERRILAALDHPFIARLLDGGVAPDGRPYLVLEYVEGVPITTFCSSHALDVRARLTLFRDVCEAVAAAHAQLVVHRDIKPSNILVGSDRRPRLLDFGIARLLDDTPDAGPLTRTHWLTPDYAAPEQFRGERATTRTDVYQLGAVLYELLAEQRPFDPEARPRDPWRTGDAPPPSTHRRSLDPDLDAIVAMAMRPEPTLRYASVTALADDVRRHQEGAPVRARIGERSYRWGRALRRRALPIAVGATAAVALALWTTTVAVQNRRIRAALATAELERAKSTQVADFLVGLFQVTDPRLGRADTISARSLLDRGESRIEGLASQPALQAALLGVVGRVRSDLGAFEDGERALRRALALREAPGEADDVEHAQLHAGLGRVASIGGRLDTAAHHYARAYAMLQSLLGDTADATRDVLYAYAFTLHSARRHAEADTLFLRWERSLSPLDGSSSGLRPTQLLDVGLALRFGRERTPARRTEGERLIERAHTELRASDDASAADVSRTAAALARVLFDRRDYDGADQVLGEGIDALRSVHPNGHPELAAAMQMRASFLMDAGRVAQGMAAYDAAVIMASASYGSDHLMVAAMRGSYGDALRRAGQLDSAIAVLTRAEGELTRAAGPEHVMTLRTRANLGDVLAQVGAHATAESRLVSAWNALSQTRGADDRHAQFALAHLLRFYDATGRTREAARYRALVVDEPDAPRGTTIP